MNPKTRTIRYDYISKRWRMIERTSTKHGIAEDIDGNRVNLIDLEPREQESFDNLADDWKLLGAIASHSKTPEDYADALNGLTHLPAELKPVIWRSLPQETRTALKQAAQSQQKCHQPNQEAQEGRSTTEKATQVDQGSNKPLQGDSDGRGDRNHSLSDSQEAQEGGLERSRVYGKGTGQNRRPDAAVDTPSDVRKQSRPHTCHAKGCDRPVKAKLFMCPQHWAQLGSKHRNAIQSVYRPGQEIDKNPSAEYIATAKAAIASLEKPKAGPERVQLINLNRSPEWLLKSNLEYCGRAHRKNQLECSPLANQKMRGQSQDERDRVCDAFVERMIVVLEVAKGPQWDELKRLAKLASKGAIGLGCYCVPERCHTSTIKLIVDGLVARKRRSQIVSELRALLPAKQPELLGV